MGRTATAERQPVTQARPQTQQPPAVRPGTAIATQERTVRSVLFDMADRFGMEPAAFEATLRNTVVPSGCTREQFAAFLLVAKEYNLNPLTKEIYAFPSKGGGIQPIVGIDGWANLVNSHPAFDGMEFDDKFDGTNLVAITCRMYRKDRAHAISATEYMIECKRNTEPWSKWPRRMLRHKAMIQAARYAFGFAGIVDPDEVERFAAETARDVTPRRIASTAAAFDEFAKVAEHTGAQDDQQPADELGGEFDEASQTETQQQPTQASQPAKQEPKGEPVQQEPTPQQGGPDISKGDGHHRGEPADALGDADAEAEGQEAGTAAPTWPADKKPTTADEYQQYADAYLAAETDASKIAEWFKGPEQRQLRNACGVGKDVFDAVKAKAMDRIAALKAGK